MLSVIIVCKKNSAEISLFFSASYHRITNYVSLRAAVAIVLSVERELLLFFSEVLDLFLLTSLDGLISSLIYRKLLDGKEGQRTSTRAKRGEEEEEQGEAIN
jgi:hypothetical protein